MAESLPAQPTREEVVAGFVKVLLERGEEAIPLAYRDATITAAWALLRDPATGFVWFWLNLAFIHIKGKGEGRGWVRACPGGEPRFCEATGKSWRWQVDVCAELVKYAVLLVLKTRQIGFSYIIANLIVWWCLAFPEQIVAATANKLGGAKRLIRRARDVYRRLPPWVRERVTLVNPAISHLEFSNGSFVEPYSGDPDATRGDAASLMVSDEIGEFDKLADFWAAVESIAETTVMFGTYKPNGLREWVEDATAGEEVSALTIDTPDGPDLVVPVYDNGLNEMSFMFVPWMAHPEHDGAWYEARQRSYRGNLTMLDREHPSSWKQAIALTGGGYFHEEKLAAQVRVMRDLEGKRERRGTLLAARDNKRDVKFVEDPYGSVVIHATPDEFAEFLEVPAAWALGADCAGDKRSGDFHAGEMLRGGNVPPHDVFDFDPELVTPHIELVTLHGHMDGDQFAEQLMRAGYLVGGALLAIEMNGVGSAVLKACRRARYPYLFRRRVKASKLVHDAPTEEYGWLTTNETKHIAYGEAERLLRNDFIELRCVETAVEMSRVRLLGSNQIGAQEPKHDDRSDALTIASAVMPYARVTDRAGRALDPDKPGYGTLEWLLAEMDQKRQARAYLGSENAGTNE